MALSTSQLRVAYAPHCRAVHHFRDAYVALDDCLRAHNYRPESGHTGAQNCRPITGGSSYSLHAYFGIGIFTFWSGVRCAMALAVDINWLRNPYGPQLITDMPRGMIDDILAVRTNSGARVWGWGGYYRGNKDAMHFEIVCSPADLATGINPRTLPGSKEMFTVGQFDDIMGKLSEIDREETIRHANVNKRLSDVENKISALEERMVGRSIPASTDRGDIILQREIAKKLGINPDEVGS